MLITYLSQVCWGGISGEDFQGGHKRNAQGWHIFNYLMCRIMMGNIHFLSHDFDQAKAMYRQTLRMSPKPTLEA